MSIPVYKTRQEQQIESLFNGAFTENKPIPFPDMTGTQAYSNLFYWAHLVAHETSEFPLHPHKGFEIITFVFKGQVEHYDTASRVYTPLRAGDVQVIQAGSGVEHSERITQGTELFQIWFDPDFDSALNRPASYTDYPAERFVQHTKDGILRLPYISDEGPIQLRTPSVKIERLQFPAGNYQLELDDAYTYSCYLLDGSLELETQKMAKDGFCIVQDQTHLNINVDKDAELFIIKSPSKVDYPLFIRRYA